MIFRYLTPIFFRLFSKERQLKMIWTVEKGSKKSFLVGTVHFFPFSFKRSLEKFISQADTVLLEGPLDKESMDKVLEEGEKPVKGFSIEGKLDTETINEINKLKYNLYSLQSSTMNTYLMTIADLSDKLYNQVKDKKPWMAFFEIWSYFGEINGWKYTMDRDALNIGKKLGKDIHCLETIEEQIDALNGIPIERITNFIKRIQSWDTYARQYVKLYLKGDLEGFISIAKEFPTYCESIIDKRDPILCERMIPFLEKGNAIFFVGITHLQGIKYRLLKDGYILS